MRPSWGCGRTQHRIFHIRRPSFARSFFDDLRLSRGKSMDRRTLRSRGLRAHILHSCRFHSPVSVPQAPRPLGSSRTLFGPFLEEMRAVFGCERSTGIYTAKIGFPLGRGVLQTLHRLLSLISLAALANLLQDTPLRCCARVFPRPRANRVSDCLTDSNGGHAGGKAVGGKPAVGPGRRLRQVRGRNRPCFGGCPGTGKNDSDFGPLGLGRGDGWARVKSEEPPGLSRLLFPTWPVVAPHQGLPNHAGQLLGGERLL